MYKFKILNSVHFRVDSFELGAVNAFFLEKKMMAGLTEDL